MAAPKVLGTCNEAILFADLDRTSRQYTRIDDEARGDARIERGECLEKCPQQIEIPEWMKVHEALAPLAPLLPRGSSGVPSRQGEITAGSYRPPIPHDLTCIQLSGTLEIDSDAWICTMSETTYPVRKLTASPPARLAGFLDGETLRRNVRRGKLVAGALQELQRVP